MSKRIRYRRPAQKGMVLITALLLLIVVTILAVGLFRSFGLDEKIAGNLREKHRALNAAETAEQYAEWWLSNNGNAGASTVCSGPLASITATTVCANVIANPATLPLPWTVGVNYIPAVPSPMNVSTLGGQDTYYFAPTFYISYLGSAPGPLGTGTVYQIDAVGYAGSPDTAAVVESTYLIQSTVGCPTCNPEG
jgi:type IV pilus assembly protein PilX